MPDIVVVGAGLGGLAVAARLAKLGHHVAVCERNRYPGGAVRFVEQGGFRWDAGASSTTLPAVIRDLFRTSGRPIERYVDLHLRTPARRHVFPDGSAVDLPTGSRGRQIEAIDAGLGCGLGEQWSSFVDGQSARWEVLRREVLDPPEGGARLGDRRVARALSARTSLATVLDRGLQDERLRLMVAYPFLVQGSPPRDVPAFGAVEAYVERSFGVWSVVGGSSALTNALVTRLDERKVDLRLNCAVTSIEVSAGRTTSVLTADGDRLPADVVITDVDPRVVLAELADGRPMAAARRAFAAATAPTPLVVTHVGLRGDLPLLPEEVVYHGDPLLVLSTAAGSAPPGAAAWTLWTRSAGRMAPPGRPDRADLPDRPDPLDVLAEHGVDVRSLVAERIDRGPADLLAETGGSSYGLTRAGWRTSAARARSINPLPGLYLLGAGMHPGPSIPYVVWGAASVAARIGKA